MFYESPRFTQNFLNKEKIKLDFELSLYNLKFTPKSQTVIFSLTKFCLIFILIK